MKELAGADAPLYRIRPPCPDDVGLILDSWRQSYWGSPAMRGMARDEYFVLQGGRIERLMRASVVLVASDVKDDSNVIAWACFAAPVLHYVWVRHECRGNGIARTLLDGAGITSFTHRSRTIERIPPGLRYTPHALDEGAS